VEAIDQDMTKPSVVTLGGSGNLGHSLQKLSPSFRDYEFLFPSRLNLPLQEVSQVVDYLGDVKPITIINAAAWTNVEGAETNHEDARKMNSTLPGILASWCSENGAYLIHFSTDYVFDGLKVDPYLEDDQKSPLSFYGVSKSEGEDLILETNNLETTIVRTSGLYGFTPNNFVMKVLAKAIIGDDLRVVNDQEMIPTNSDDLAAFSLSLLGRAQLPKVVHFSNEGSTNWNEVARAIYRFVGQDPEKVKRISSNEYETRAKRPRQSRLGTIYPNLTKEDNQDWLDSLQRFLKEVTHG